VKLNRYLFGTVAVGYSSIFCLLFVVLGIIALHARKTPESIIDFVSEAVAMQRLPFLNTSSRLA
jgi:hypothetical protein